ncbi:MAG: endopeptidase La [Patescibacteria group bacterium]
MDIMAVPLIALKNSVFLPHTEAVYSFTEMLDIHAIELASRDKKNLYICLTWQKENGMASLGTLAKMEKVIKGEKEINVLFHGVARVKINNIDNTDQVLVATVEEIPEIVEDSVEMRAACDLLLSEFKHGWEETHGFDFLAFINIVGNNNPIEYTDKIAATLPLKPEEKQIILQTNNVRQRAEITGGLLIREVQIIELEAKMSEEASKKFSKEGRENYLREKKKAIEKELGEIDEDEKETTLLSKQIDEKKLPETVAKKAKKELERLKKMSPYNPEAGYIRAFLDWLLELPWNEKSENNKDIKTAVKILDEDHYGLEKIKERILEYLAVMKLRHEREAAQQNLKDKPKNQGVIPTILCFVGPPGVGKTSIGKSIARALGRKFVKVSLGGIRDEAEIRGHRRTYVGALPGRIIQGIKTAGTKNPVFMLDEIDKIGNDYHGDPSAALLEALDPEQNHEFSDHYLELSFDLSEVMFITTANILDTIPPALRDRLEIIHFPGYTTEEKFHIAKNFLLKKQMLNHALSDQQISFTDKALGIIIAKYTREAGVRELERQMEKAMRKVARKTANGKTKKTVITGGNLTFFLGPYKFSHTEAEKENEIGIATGLAWTQAGGEILFIETAVMPGKGSLVLTGMLGEVMQESARAALSFVRAKYKELGLEEKFYQKIDLHIHVPEGAVPKDGPSAGVAIVTSLVSALTKKPVKKEIGMTGEITLRGRVLEVGGVKEKLLAARRAGLQTVIMPMDNKKDLEDVPKYVKKDINFVFVSSADEVLKAALADNASADKQGK